MDKLLTTLKVKKNKLFTFGNNLIDVASINFYDKVHYDKNSKNSKLNTVDMLALSNFLKVCKVVRLNHLGICYVVDNIDSEVNFLRKNIKKHNLYYEPNNSKKQKWLFVGNNNSNKITPMFELVLIEGKQPKKPTLWKPHYQIDYDTNNTYEELVALSKKYFGKNIFTWKLNIPDYGVVLAMGSIGRVNGISVILGCGTRLRNSKNHRKEMIQLK